MADIISFPERPGNEDIPVWRCNCGCITHFARSDGSLECANCQDIAADGTGSWRIDLPDVPEKPERTDTGDVKVTDFNDQSVAIRRIFRRAEDESLAGIVLLKNNGSITCWSHGFDTSEQVEWLDHKMSEARKLLVGKE